VSYDDSQDISIFFPSCSFLEICVFRERVMILTYGRSREWIQERLTYQLYSL